MNEYPKTRTYGGDKTIHRTTELDVEVHCGEVVAVWFRCQPLPFHEVTVNRERAVEMHRMYATLPGGPVQLVSIEIVDP